jgi:hypothetical protein
MPDSDTTMELQKLFAALLGDNDKRRMLGERARQLVNKNRGATERTMESLKTLLPFPVAPADSSTRGHEIART